MTPAAPLILNPEGRRPGLIVVDHAGERLPEGLDLGLDPIWQATHHFCDIGVADLARRIAARLDLPVVMCDVSRLVLDVNRWLEDPRSILTELEGGPIPGNLNLDPARRLARQEAVFWPYHAAVGRLWAAQTDRHARPFFLALHSCTRVFGGVRRPWDGGTIWHDDRQLSQALLSGLGRDSGLVLGDNQPYSGRDGVYTVDRHSYGSGLPACGFEVTNDGLETAAGRAAWADRLAVVLADVMETPA